MIPEFVYFFKKEFRLRWGIRGRHKQDNDFLSMAQFIYLLVYLAHSVIA